MTKNKKTRLALALTLIALGLTACKGGNTAPTSSSAAAEIETTTAESETPAIESEISAAVSETSAAVSETSAAKPSSEVSKETAAGEKTISGIVTGGTEHSINITADDGTELEFYIGDNTVADYEDGLLIDRKVLITYTGSIDGTDTDSAEVLKVSDFK